MYGPNKESNDGLSVPVRWVKLFSVREGSHNLLSIVVLSSA